MTDVLGADLPAQEALTNEIAKAEQGERIWQVVSAATNDIIDKVWHLMPPSERSEYYTRWRSLWMARRATFPLQNAQKLQHYFKEGTLHVLNGFQHCVYDDYSRKFTICAETVKDQPASEYHFDYVINATSFSLDASRTNDPLVTQLLNREHALVDPFGGLKLDYETGCILDARGEIQPTISLLGSLAVGTYFWTISMDVNARLALSQARRIANELTTRQAA